MDLDLARRTIQEAPDVAGISDVLLDLLEVVGRLDDDLARLRQRVEYLERTTAVTDEIQEPTT